MIEPSYFFDPNLTFNPESLANFLLIEQILPTVKPTGTELGWQSHWEKVFLVEDTSPEWVQHTRCHHIVFRILKLNSREETRQIQETGAVDPMGVNRPNDSLPKSDRTSERGREKKVARWL